MPRLQYNCLVVKAGSIDEIDLTPLRKQYLDVKKRYPNEIVFFRLGDFYETFDDDAELVARELDIVLTSRPVAKGARVPMAGIPHHAVESYLGRLIAKGYHVAICDQVGGEPQKGLFERQVTRVVTPGTVVEPGLLSESRNNYLAALVVEAAEGDGTGRAGLAYADITTGEFAATQFQAAQIGQLIRHELARLTPAELLIPEGLEAARVFPPTSAPCPPGSSSRSAPARCCWSTSRRAHCKASAWTANRWRCARRAA